MSKEFALRMPYNNVSFGFCSYAITKELFRQGYNPCIFPIGQWDTSAQVINQDFGLWLQNNMGKAIYKHNRANKCVTLWHINDALHSFSEKQTLITFLETDSCSPAEVNILNNQEMVFVTSQYTKEVMEENGVRRVKYLPLGFDKDNFYPTNKTYLSEDITVFGLFGKFEMRKAHARCLKTWASIYGNNPKYRLHAAVYNPFFSPEDNQRLIAQALDNKVYWNISFLPYMKTNAEYNDFINSIDIAISMSGGEGFNLPLFHSIGLGRHAVALAGHVHLDYCNSDNCVLVPPNGKIRAVDNAFFQENSPFNTGNFFSYSDDDFVSGLKEAEKRMSISRRNEAGLKLQNLTYKNTVETILSVI